MILFSREIGIMISDIYGGEGSNELRALAKKMRLDRDHLRQEGHPADEHYTVPASKHDGMAARGVKVLSPADFAAARDAKRRQVRVNTQISPPPVPANEPSQEDVTDFYRGHTRRMSERSRQHRQERRAS